MNQQEFNFASMVRIVNFAKINSSQNKPAIRYCFSSKLWAKK